MLAGTHILIGVLIWEMSPGPWWVRVPLSVAGGYVSHYVLDSVATYHDCWPDSWVDVALVWVQMGCVAIAIANLVSKWRREYGR